MIEVVLRRVGVTRLPKPRVLACIASESSEVERRAVDEAVRFAGGKGVVLVEEPLAAAIGAGLPIHEPVGNLIVDIGGGTTEMAIVSMGGVVTGVVDPGGRVRPRRGDPGAHPHHARRRDRREGGRADQDRDRLGVPDAAGQGGAVVTGRELTSGAPARRPDLTEDEVRQAMSEPVNRIVEAARRTLAEAPPELTHDVLETGMFLTGGGGLLRGPRPAPLAGVRGPGAPHRPAAGNRRARSRRDARAPRRLPELLPAGEAPVTFSIVAADPRAGDWGVAVASKFPAVGAVVPWAERRRRRRRDPVVGEHGLRSAGSGADGQRSLRSPDAGPAPRGRQGTRATVRWASSTPGAGPRRSPGTRRPSGPAA